ncbi:MAG: hypothetical protein EZS28_020484 [Streblomastix strix]|uniref:Uncharacterized protein n=1 Tax=Streblomastix strix TaxID=222440 RepID=A0A5J4VN38_9EUKA|nr:MAG: hypothetical protein EZS28_020484 [Streblomastix strix]
MEQKQANLPGSVFVQLFLNIRNNLRFLDEGGVCQFGGEEFSVRTEDGIYMFVVIGIQNILDLKGNLFENEFGYENIENMGNRTESVICDEDNYYYQLEDYYQLDDNYNAGEFVYSPYTEGIAMHMAMNNATASPTIIKPEKERSEVDMEEAINITDAIYSMISFVTVEKHQEKNKVKLQEYQLGQSEIG